MTESLPTGFTNKSLSPVCRLTCRFNADLHGNALLQNVHLKHFVVPKVPVYPTDDSSLGLVVVLRPANISIVVRKPVFGVSDQVPHKPGSTTAQDG